MKSVHSDKYNEFLKLIIAARKKGGFTQKELADRLKKPQSYVSKYERGERRIDIIEFMEVSKSLKIDPCGIIKKIGSNSA